MTRVRPVPFAAVLSFLLLLAAGAPASPGPAPGSAPGSAPGQAPSRSELVDALALLADGETERGAARLETLAERAGRDGDRGAEGLALWGLATARVRQGRPASARDLAAVSRAAFEAAGDGRWVRRSEALEAEAARLLDGGTPETDAFEAAFLEEVGLLEAKRLRFGDALRRFDGALARIEGTGRTVQEAGLYAYRGMILALLQRFEPARADMERFSELAVAAEPELEPVISLTRELVLGVASWRFERVIDELERIGELYPNRLPGWFYDNLDFIDLLREGRVEAAAGVCRQVLGAAAGPEPTPPEGMLRAVGMACAAVDVLAAAQDGGDVPTRELLALGLSVMRTIEAQPEPFRGALERLAGQFLSLASEPEAKELWANRSDFQAALAPLQDLIAQAAPPDLRAGLDSALTPMIELFAGVEGSLGDPAEAYALAEEARSRELLDRLVDARLVGAGDARTAERIAELRARRDALEGELREARWGGAAEADLALLDEELAGVRRELDLVFDRLAVHPGKGRPTVARQEPVPLEEVRKALDSDTTLVAFLTFSSTLDDTLAWVVDRDRIEQVTLPVRAEDLERRVGFLVESLRRLEDLTGPAEELYRTLWAPIRSHVRTRRVLLVPHGPLQELPFAALRDPESGLWLAQQATLLHAPSASAWVRLRGRSRAPAQGPSQGRAPDAGRPPLVVGTAGGALPAAADEIRSVAALWGVRPLLGAEASEAALRAGAPGVALVHVSSHGVLDREDPLFSRLELAPSPAGGAGSATDPRRDGRLELHEVVNELDLRGTRLVVLPACHTGQGPRTRGDEVASLARAFLLAGARAAVTTGWAVDDDATATLMVDFHRHLAAGTEVAEALRRAQEAALATVDRSHPWYWAGFALHGAGGTLPAPDASQPSAPDRVGGGGRPGKERDR